MTQPTINLLPCPFCGGTAGMRENGIGDYYVKCFVCEAKASEYRCEEPTHAAGRWNRRAAQTAQAGDGNRLPLEEMPIGVQFNSLYKSLRGDKYCSILKDVHNGEIRLFYGDGRTPAEALRAAIERAKDGAS